MIRKLALPTYLRWCRDIHSDYLSDNQIVRQPVTAVDEKINTLIPIRKIREKGPLGPLGGRDRIEGATSYLCQPVFPGFTGPPRQAGPLFRL